MPRYHFRAKRTLAAQARRVSGALNSGGEKPQQRRTASSDKAHAALFKSYNDGSVERVRIGLQSDGSFGLRIWDSLGVLQVNQTFF